MEVLVDLSAVQTNMIYLSVPDAPALAARLAKAGVLGGALGPNTLRLVTHYEITDADISSTLAVMETCLAEMGPSEVTGTRV